MKIIGITGPQASGKGTVVEYLVAKLGFLHLSASDLLTELLVAQNQPVNRDTMRVLANQLREQYGPSALAEMLYEKAKIANQNAIIESIRTIWEVEKLKEKSDFLLLSVDASQDLRFQRALERKSAKDNVSREEFAHQEALEADNQDPTKANIKACQSLADIHLDNNGELSDLHSEIEQKIIPLLCD